MIKTRTTIYCKKDTNFYSEFTLEEILKILPPRIIRKSTVYNPIFEKTVEEATGVWWYYFEYRALSNNILYGSFGIDLYKGAADILVWCIENDHIIVQEISPDKERFFQNENSLVHGK